MTLAKHIAACLICMTYLSLSLLGLFAMGEIHHHNMASMHDCPFMLGEQSLCMMDFTEHIVAWQQLTMATLMDLALLVIPLFIVYFFVLFRPPNHVLRKSYERPYRERFIVSLFSHGILHPKAP